jgi:hypothetical protein
MEFTMKLTSKICLSVLASALLLGINAPVSADRGEHGGHGGVTVTNLTATLVASTTSPVGYTGTGSINYSSSVNGSSLQASVHLPVDGSSIADSNAAVTDAANGLVTLTISNSTGGVVATYNLAISDIDFAYSSATTVSSESVEFAVAASESTTVPYAVTLGSSTSTTLPVLAVGDTVSLSVNGKTLLTSSAPLALGSSHH